MTIGEGWNIDQPENSKLSLLAQLLLHHNNLIQHLHYCVFCSNWSVNLLIHCTQLQF